MWDMLGMYATNIERIGNVEIIIRCIENMKEKVDDCSHKLEELKNTIDGDEKVRIKDWLRAQVNTAKPQPYCSLLTQAAVIIIANQNTCLALKLEIDLLYDCKQILSQ